MNQSKNSGATTSSHRATARHPWLIILIFRLLLLSVGGGIALLLGIVVASVYPNPNPEKPLFFKLLEHLDKKTLAVYAEPSPPSAPSPTNSAPQLTPVQRQQIIAKLNQLQAQLTSMNEAVTTLESQLGISRSSPNATLEARMQAIAVQLQGVSSSHGSDRSLRSASANQLTSISESVSASEKMKVTLPSDLLFEGNNSILRPEAALILDKIITDLRGYPSSTIRIAVHTSAADNVDTYRELSFRRAKAVQQYLASALGDRYRWLITGYGGSQPLVANDTDANQQRNRRIEIAVE